MSTHKICFVGGHKYVHTFWLKKSILSGAIIKKIVNNFKGVI